VLSKDSLYNLFAIPKNVKRKKDASNLLEEARDSKNAEMENINIDAISFLVWSYVMLYNFNRLLIIFTQNSRNIIRHIIP